MPSLRALITLVKSLVSDCCGPFGGVVAYSEIKQEAVSGCSMVAIAYALSNVLYAIPVVKTVKRAEAVKALREDLGAKSVALRTSLDNQRKRLSLAAS